MLCHLKERRKKFRIYRCHPVGTALLGGVDIIWDRLGRAIRGVVEIHVQVKVHRVVMRNFTYVVQCISVGKVHPLRSGSGHSNQGAFVHGTHHSRDVPSRGWIVHWRWCPRDVSYQGPFVQEQKNRGHIGPGHIVMASIFSIRILSRLPILSYPNLAPFIFHLRPIFARIIFSCLYNTYKVRFCEFYDT